jgi:hypothetical protein
LTTVWAGLAEREQLRSKWAESRELAWVARGLTELPAPQAGAERLFPLFVSWFNDRRLRRSLTLSTLS